jgi:hypothetical protein
MMVIVVVQFTINGPEAVCSNETGTRCRLGTSDWQQLIEVPNRKSHAVHMGEDCRARIAEFQYYTILKFIAVNNFRLALPFFGMPVNIAKQKILQPGFVS